PDGITEASLNAMWEGFSEEDALLIKRTEQTTNHDGKAAEYLIKEKLESAGGAAITAWVQLGLTSHDVTSTATPRLWTAPLAPARAGRIARDARQRDRGVCRTAGRAGEAPRAGALCRQVRRRDRRVQCPPRRLSGGGLGSLRQQLR